MKITKRIVSSIVAMVFIVSAVPLSAIESFALPVSAVADASLVLNRPVASVVATEVTRVAYATDSMKQPSGDNSVIVSATPSGVPHLAGRYASLAYAGETPAYTQVSFTPGIELEAAPTITCSNTTVTMSNYTYANGTYVWQVTGGTAVVGTTLIFTVSYSFSEVSSVTGKTYSHTYQTRGTSYVEAIANLAGMFSTKRTYEDFFFGTSTKNRSYIGSYILGINTYGSIYNNGTGDGSVDFTGTASWTETSGWTADYGIMKNFSGSDASRQYNVAYSADANRPISYVYLDRSIHSTLSDVNLRLQTVLPTESNEADENVEVSVNNIFVQSGVVSTFSSSSTTDDPATDASVASQLGLITYEGSIKGAGQNMLMYFSGVGPDTTSATDYTVAVKYQTSAQWSGVYVGQSHSIEVVSYDKGSLRTLVEEIYGTDPTVMTTELPDGEFKGYNPQSWYYASGWETFLNAYNAAKACLDKPNATQEQIDAQYDSLTEAYSSLTLQTADYSLATAYYNQAQKKVQTNYTLASWAKLKTAMDNYQENYSILYQPAVDKMAIDIKYAMDNLVEANADYSEFLVLLSAANRIAANSKILYGVEASSAYSNWSTVETVLRNSGCVYNSIDGYVVDTYLPISSQSTVDGYTMLLENALNALTLVGADYSAATKAEAAYKAINLSYIQDYLVPDLQSAYNNLVALHGLDISRQNDINTAVIELNYQLDNIEYKPADTQAAEELIAYANSLDKTLYTDFSAVTTAIANLQSKLNLDIRYQSEITTSTAALQSAIDKLVENKADYSKVDEAIAAADEIKNNIQETYKDTYGYTVTQFYSNWSAVEKAIAAVQRGLTVSQQSTVDGYATAINSAIAALAENKADYSKVTQAQSNAYAIINATEHLYTTASIDALTAAYVGVVNNLTISKQNIVDGYATAINEAIANLEYLDADYSSVNTQITAANAKISIDNAYQQAHPGYTYYTVNSMAALNGKISDVVYNLDIRYQTQVNGYATATKTAISQLVLAGADYSQVDSAISSIPTDLSLYTTLSVATLNATVKSVNRTYTADKQTTVDKYVTAINNAIAALEYKNADYSAVTTALGKVPADSSVYTKDSWDNLQAKIGAVVYNLNITHQAEVDTFASDIEAAIRLLQPNGADYSNVDAAIANVPADLTIYTENSVKVLNDAINAVDRTLDVTQQATVDGYATSINEAIGDLEKLKADYSEVDLAVGSVPADLTIYTEDSVKALNDAINAVDRTLDITQQSTVDAYADAINEAVSNLLAKTADYTAYNTAVDRLETLKDVNETEYNRIKEIADAIEEGLNITHQAEINTAATNINTELDGVLADYTSVTDAITDAQEKIATGNYTDESVADLQAKINAVDYTLNFENQKEVNAFATDIVNYTNNLELKLADYTELQNLLDLLDNPDSDIYNNNYSNYDEIISLITTYRTDVVSNNMNLTIDRQEDVDAMVTTLQGYIDSLVVNVVFKAKEGSTTVISGEYIYGLKTNLTKSSFENDYVTMENVTVTYKYSGSRRYLGTGATVTVTSNVTNEVIGVYYIVIYGDVDGDSSISSTDVDLMSKVISGTEKAFDGAYFQAANIRKDRYFDSSDKAVLKRVLTGTVYLNQATGKAK